LPQQESFTSPNKKMPYQMQHSNERPGIPPVAPHDPMDPDQDPDSIPLPPDSIPQPREPIREPVPDRGEPEPITDPQPHEPTRLLS